jgi:hypothetical protein
MTSQPKSIIMNDGKDIMEDAIVLIVFSAWASLPMSSVVQVFAAPF